MVAGTPSHSHVACVKKFRSASRRVRRRIGARTHAPLPRGQQRAWTGASATVRAPVQRRRRLAAGSAAARLHSPMSKTVLFYSTLPAALRRLLQRMQPCYSMRRARRRRTRAQRPLDGRWHAIRGRVPMRRSMRERGVHCPRPHAWACGAPCGGRTCVRKGRKRTGGRAIRPPTRGAVPLHARRIRRVARASRAGALGWRRGGREPVLPGALHIELAV